RACDRGNVRGCLGLGKLGEALGDLVDAAKSYARACAKLDEGCRARQAVVKAIGARCDAGDCYELGALEEAGIGVDKDEKRAAAHYDQACDKGSAKACTALGLFYDHGPLGFEFRKAERLFRKACDQDELEGCKALGILYMVEGNGSQKAKAPKILEDACAKG